MELREFVRQVAGFDDLSHPDKIRLFAWHLHAHRRLERFGPAAVRECYQALNLPCPDLRRDIQRLSERRPAELLRDRRGYYLVGPARRQLDGRYGEHETVIAVSQLLKNLPGKVSNEAERLFLSEALTCYKHQAFRAAIVMTWNLAYDHLLSWLVADAERVAAFNACIVGRIGSKRGTGLAMARREDFEELKEAEVIDICGSAGVLPSHNVKQILDEQLKRRNRAAHPSLIEIQRPQADDTITSLVNNVVLKLV